MEWHQYMAFHSSAEIKVRFDTERLRQKCQQQLISCSHLLLFEIARVLVRIDLL
jgi:hypothetical protein